MNDMISVIIPVYNVEQYVGRCIESVINQTYKMLEIILVDDGSTDMSGEICDDYSVKDSRIKVIHKKNGGLSDARNAGIREFTGKYVTFIDSDDYISTHMINDMMDILLRENAEIIQCNFIEGEKGGCYFPTEGGYDVYDNHAIFELNETKISVCGKIYNRRLIENHFFPKGRKNEDEFYTYKCLYESNRTVLLHRQLYYYYKRPGSIMHSHSSRLNLDVIDAYNERELYFKEKNEKRLYDITVKEKLIREAMMYVKARKCENASFERKELKEMFNRDYQSVRREKFDVKEKIFLSLFYRFPIVADIVFLGRAL